MLVPMDGIGHSWNRRDDAEQKRLFAALSEFVWREVRVG